MPSKQQRTRNRIFQCRDFARDTGTIVRLRLTQPSPDHPGHYRKQDLMFTPNSIERMTSPPTPITIQEASKMADMWTQEKL